MGSTIRDFELDEAASLPLKTRESRRWLLGNRLILPDVSGGFGVVELTRIELATS